MLIQSKTGTNEITQDIVPTAQLKKIDKQKEVETCFYCSAEAIGVNHDNRNTCGLERNHADVDFTVVRFFE